MSLPLDRAFSADMDQTLHIFEFPTCRPVLSMQEELLKVSLPKPGGGKLQPMGQIWPLACFRPAPKLRMVFTFVKGFYICKQIKQKQEYAAEIVHGPAKPEIFMTWPFMETICQPLL